jgi:hypothetical protein
MSGYEPRGKKSTIYPRTMTNDTLQNAIKNLKQTDKNELKLPSGESVQIKRGENLIQPSESSDQNQNLKDSPKIDFPAEDSENGDQ